MATREDDDPITEMKLSLRTVENRLENSETTQKTTAQRLNELYQALSERLGAKDDTVIRLREQSEWILRQNDTLLKQIGLRWNLLTGLTTLVGIAFTITLGYQIWRVEQVMETKRALDDGTKLLARNTKAYSEILSKLAEADTLMSESNREFQRAEYNLATNLATNATAFLTSALSGTGIDTTELQKRTLYDGATCTMNTNTAAVSKKITPDSDYALSPEVLYPSVREALVNAYDLHARATFFSTPKGDTRDDGAMMLTLDPARWEGYHWVGLAAESEGRGSFAEAKACLERSVDRNKVGNKDYINLAELSFINSEYPGAMKHADRYLRSVNYRFKSPIDVVAFFYFSTAGFLANDVSARNKMSPEAFQKKLDGLPDFTLEGTFSPGDLLNFLSSEEFTAAATLTSDQKKQVQLSANCLTDRRKCKG